MTIRFIQPWNGYQVGQVATLAGGTETALINGGIARASTDNDNAGGTDLQAQITAINAVVITSRYGALSPGDILRTDAAYAKHLVEECAAAKYDGPVVSGVPAAEPGAESPAPVPAAGRKTVKK